MIDRITGLYLFYERSLDYLKNLCPTNIRSHRAATLGNGVNFMRTFGSRSKSDAENDGADLCWKMVPKIP